MGLIVSKVLGSDYNGQNRTSEVCVIGRMYDRADSSWIVWLWPTTKWTSPNGGRWKVSIDLIQLFYKVTSSPSQ